MSNKDVMQFYFDELLNEDKKSLSQAAPHVVAPTPGPQTNLSSSPQSLPTLENFKEVDANKLALASLQKQKLQALLDQQHLIEQKQTDVKPAPVTLAKLIKPPAPIVTPIPEEPIELEEESDLDVQVSELLRWHANGRPLWAQQEFDVLLFEVSGLVLAVPLIALGQIQPLGDELTPIFGQSDWFMGLLSGPQGNIKTVNTALFVMPEKYNKAFLNSARFVISIDGLPWGLAVDSVHQPSRIHPDEVKWRTDRSKRPWLAGTVKSAMCALIDIPMMGKILSESEK